MKRFIRRVLLAGAFIWLPVAAQPFPAGPIHVVVPLAPGDAADTTAGVSPCAASTSKA
jgi:tripartite-type tricarboxylate transporter receptor subunit TctC